MEVNLFAAGIPGLSWFAEHYWLETCCSDKTLRWEVWHKKQQCQNSWGHLHQNLLLPGQWSNLNTVRHIQTWSGNEALKINNQLMGSPETYPYKYQYRYWPGPNSNTYIQYILEQANVTSPLGLKALGKNYQTLQRLVK